MKVLAIIFDLGGVVLNNDWHDSNQNKFLEYSKVFNITYDEMEKGWTKAWPDYSIGKISEDEFWTIFLTEAGSSNIDIEKAKNLWRKYVVENEKMILLLTKLKEKYKLGALTTISKDWLDYKSNKYNLNEIFDIIVSSGYYGIEKPDEKIFKKVIKELGVEFNESIYIDDSPNTLAPANKLGIHTLLFESQEKLEEKLKEFGVTF